jgi:hypothetical protein
MQVVHCLPSVNSRVDDASKSTFGKAFSSRYFPGDNQQMTQQALVLLPGILNSGQWFFRDDQNVDRCLGIDVAKRHAAIVFVDDIGGYFTFDDF